MRVRCGPGGDAEKAISGNEMSLCTILFTGLCQTCQTRPHRSAAGEGPGSWPSAIPIVIGQPGQDFDPSSVQQAVRAPRLGFL